MGIKNQQMRCFYLCLFRYCDIFIILKYITLFFSYFCKVREKTCTKKVLKITEYENPMLKLRSSGIDPTFWIICDFKVKFEGFWSYQNFLTNKEKHFCFLHF